MICRKKRRLFIAFALTVSVTLMGVTSTSAFTESASANVEVNVQVQQNTKGSVNWDKGAEADVEAIGIGLPPENMGVRGNILARRAAVVDAQRNLAEMIQGVQIDSETVMENLVIASDGVRSKVSAMVKGARIVDEGVNADGSYFVKMRVPMYGVTNSIASVALPEIRDNMEAEPLPEVTDSTLSESDVKDVQRAAYTGVVINATGMGLEPTFSPVIYDVNGRVVYGIRNLEVINAVGVRGGKNSVNKVNVVVSVEDGDRILLASEKSGILQNCAVVFVR